VTTFLDHYAGILARQSRRLRERGYFASRFVTVVSDDTDVSGDYLWERGVYWGLSMVLWKRKRHGIAQRWAK
jgi:hypothetical protein